MIADSIVMIGVIKDQYGIDIELNTDKGDDFIRYSGGCMR
jgi:hypothetical protein